MVIPTLNEAEAIGKTVDELKQHGFTKILVVDGHSVDGTQRIAEQKGAKVVRQEGRGKADALRTAIGHVETPYTLVIDGDYTYDPSYIESMLRHAEEYDEVIGARVNGKENIPLLHRFGNRAITKAFNLLLGTRLKDVCSGMYLIKTEVAREVDHDCHGFSSEVEFAAHVASTSRRIIDVPAGYRPRIGNPKLKSRHGISILSNAVRLAWRYNPAFFIFACGSMFLIPSLIVLGWVAFEHLFMGATHFVWAILGVVGLGVGATSSLLAIMALYVKRMEYRMLDGLKKLQARS